MYRGFESVKSPGKSTVVLNNRRHLLMISHKQRITAKFLRRIPFRVGPPEIFHKETPQEIKKICKQAGPHRLHKVSARNEISLCKGVQKHQNAHVCITTLFHDVLHYFCYVFAFWLVSLHGVKVSLHMYSGNV